MGGHHVIPVLVRFSEQGNKFGFTSGSNEFALLSSNLNN